MKNMIFTLILMVAFSTLLAQIDMPRPNFSPYSLKSSLPGLQMSHSMGFEAGTSSVGNGYYLSRYTNHLSYSFNPKLDMDLDLNFVNFGSMNTKSDFSLNEDNSSKVLPDFSLRYRPSDTMSFEVRFSQGIMNRRESSWLGN